MVKKILLAAIYMALTMVLAGCVSMRGPIISKQQRAFKPLTRVQIVHQLQNLTAWQADGAFSFDAGQQVGIANFRIDVTPFAWRLHIASGLNLVQMTMGRDAMGVWYTDQNGHIQHALSLDAIMKAQFGFSLPYSILIHWVKGLPASATAAVQLDAFNHLQSLSEKGWRLSYGKYALYHGVALPGEIMITGHGEKIKMVIKQWDIGTIHQKNKKSH